jgi:hypothetical protein
MLCQNPINQRLKFFECDDSGYRTGKEMTKEKSMLKITLTIFGLIVALLVISSCGHSISGQRESLLSSNWGKSFEAAKYNQILNPNAGKNFDPVDGLDGPAAEENVNKYRKSFQDKPSKQTYNLNLGTVGGIGNP